MFIVQPVASPGMCIISGRTPFSRPVCRSNRPKRGAICRARRSCRSGYRAEFRRRGGSLPECHPRDALSGLSARTPNQTLSERASKRRSKKLLVRRGRLAAL